MGGQSSHSLSRGSPELFLIVFLERAARKPHLLLRRPGAELDFI
jgi:hypothetical protein